MMKSSPTIPDRSIRSPRIKIACRGPQWRDNYRTKAPLRGNYCERNEKYTGRFVAGHAPPLSLEYRRRTTRLSRNYFEHAVLSCVPLLEARSTTFNREFSSDCTASRIVKFIFPNFYIRLFSFLDIICVEM